MKQRDAVDRLMDVSARVMDFERDLPRLRSDLRSVTEMLMTMERQLRKQGRQEAAVTDDFEDK